MLQEGTLFDSRYELTRLIGRGGFAEVWLVKDTLAGLEEALKIYAPGSGMDEDGLKIFAKELSVVHDLRHTNLLTPKSLGQYDHQPYLILPFCPNGSLNKFVGQCTEDQAWKILEQVAAGLAYLHKRNIVHQDIKPDNILIDANMDYVITDFGISLKAQSTLRKSVRDQANSGTMAYMAPERFSAEPHPIPANDIWSLGAMMFELVEGNVPFMAQLGGLAQKNGADMPIMHGDAGNELKQVIRAMLSPNAEDRPTAAELVNCAKSRTASSPSPKYAAIPKQEVTTTPNSNPTSAVEEKKTQIIDMNSLPKRGASQIQQGYDAYYASQQPAKPTPKSKPSVPKVRKESSSAPQWIGIIGGILLITAIALGALYMGQTGSAEDDYVAVDTVAEVYGDVDSETSASLQSYVDLGLPSGTRWNDQNEEGFYDYDEAVDKYGNNLPTKEQLEELKSKCKWTWTGNGYKVEGPNGNHIYLPAAGCHDSSGSVHDIPYGYYLSSTPYDSEDAWLLSFYSSKVWMGYQSRRFGWSVRLVR
jgi:serine/threonine protein kinase